jgi:hypothetical protein
MDTLTCKPKITTWAWNKASKANGSICLDLGLHAQGILISLR